MSALGVILQQIADGLATAQTARVVTRSLKEPAQRDDAELAKGVYTVLSRSETLELEVQRQLAEGELAFLIVGQVKVAEDAEPVAIEEAELTMVDEIKAFANALPAGLCGIDLTGWRQSAQLEHPYGWVIFDMVYSDT